MLRREDIKNIAMLSKLYVDESEIDLLTEEMQKIVDFADTINDAQVSDNDFDNINNLQNAFRSDCVVKSYDKDDILKNAKDVCNDHFLVRKKA